MAWSQVKMKLYFVLGFVLGWAKETLRATRILRLIQMGANACTIYISHGFEDYRVIYINVKERYHGLEIRTQACKLNLFLKTKIKTSKEN